MSGPFVTITVRQYNALQDVVVAAAMVEDRFKCGCDLLPCHCGEQELKAAMERWRRLEHGMA